MKFSGIAALCTAPLALAGTLQAGLNLAERGEIAVASQQTEVSSNSNSNSNSNSKNNNNSNSNSVTEVSETEIIIIWANDGGNSATTTMAAAMSTTAGATVATHSVTVGGSAGLVYTPDTIEAAVGDMVVFQFESQNHTATQSAFTTPCEALAGGVDSGFMPNANNSVSPAPQMAMQVTVATPIWFYCRQTGHCGKGMTFSINPTANKTQAMFQQMAIAQNGTGTSSGITGGTSAAATTVSVAATSVAATSVAAANSAAATMASGTGSTNTAGACECACLCGTAAFPASVQGLLNFGGMSGAMPMSAIEA